LLAIGWFGFGICVSGGLTAAGLTAPLTAYWVGFVLLIGAMVGGLVLGVRSLRRDRAAAPASGRVGSDRSRGPLGLD
jgi:hypothetical protein